jgi:ribose transport system substrate-binding protein
MFRSKSILFLALTIILIMGVFSFGYAADEGTILLGVGIRDLANPYHAALGEGGKLYAQSIGQEKNCVILACEGSSEKQLNDIKALIARSKGEVVFLIDPNEAQDALAIAIECEKQKVYFVTQWNKPADVKVSDYKYWVTHIGIDSVTTGYEISKTLFDAIGGKGKVFAIQGMLGNNAAVGRWQGFQKALKEYPGINLVSWEVGDWEKAKAFNLTANALIANPDLAAVWCANDSMAMGALEALRAKGLAGKVPVCGADAIPEMLDAIKKGEAVATASTDPLWQAGEGLAIALAAKMGKIDVATLPENKREWEAPSVQINSKNIDWFIKTYITTHLTYDYDNYWGKWTAK